jgi:hypothetical protein
MHVWPGKVGRWTARETPMMGGVSPFTLQKVRNTPELNPSGTSLVSIAGIAREDLRVLKDVGQCAAMHVSGSSRGGGSRSSRETVGELTCSEFRPRHLPLGNSHDPLSPI